MPDNSFFDATNSDVWNDKQVRAAPCLPMTARYPLAPFGEGSKVMFFVLPECKFCRRDGVVVKTRQMGRGSPRQRFRTARRICGRFAF